MSHLGVTELLIMLIIVCLMRPVKFHLKDRRTF